MVPARQLPFIDGNLERAVPAQGCPVAVDPAGQSIPFAQEGFVRHLNGRPPGCLIAVEQQEPVAAERFEHVRQDDRVQAEVSQLRELGPPPRLGASVAQAHEAQEHLHRGPLLLWPQLRVHDLRAVGQDAAQATKASVAGEGEGCVGLLVEQLRQCVLEHRQAARPVSHLGDEFGQ